MIDPVAEYIRIERTLLAHRCAERIAGRRPSREDPFEVQAAERFDELWDQMTAEQRRNLHALRDARSAPWFVPRESQPDEDSPSPRETGLPPRRRADPFRRENPTCT